MAHKTIIVATVTAIIASAAYGQDRGAAPLVGAGAGGTGSSGSSNLNSNRGGLPPANSGSFGRPYTSGSSAHPPLEARAQLVFHPDRSNTRMILRQQTSFSPRWSRRHMRRI